MPLMRQPSRAAGRWYALLMYRRVCPAPIQIQWTIVVSNLQPRTRSATRATPPIPARSVLLNFRQVRHRPCRSISRPAVAFVPLLVSNSQRTWQQCLVCPLSISVRQQLPKFKVGRTRVFWLQRVPPVFREVQPYLPQTAVSRRTVPPQIRLTLQATAASTSTRQASQLVAVLRRGETNAIT